MDAKENASQAYAKLGRQKLEEYKLRKTKSRRGGRGSVIGSEAGSVACSEADPAQGGTSLLPSRQSSLGGDAHDAASRPPLVPAPLGAAAPPGAAAAADSALRHTSTAASRPGSAAGEDTLLPRGPLLAAADDLQQTSTATSRRAQAGVGSSKDAAHHLRASGGMSEQALRLELSNLVQHLAVFKDKAAELETENEALKARLGDPGAQDADRLLESAMNQLREVQAEKDRTALKLESVTTDLQRANLKYDTDMAAVASAISRSKEREAQLLDQVDTLEAAEGRSRRAQETAEQHLREMRSQNEHAQQSLGSMVDTFDDQIARAAEEARAEAQQQLAELTQQLAEEQSRSTSLGVVVADLEKRLSGTDHELTLLEEQNEELQRRVGEDMTVAAVEIAELKRELRGLSESVHDEREYSSSLRTQLASMRDAHELDVEFRVQQASVECEELHRQLEDAAAQLRLRDDNDADWHSAESGEDTLEGVKAELAVAGTTLTTQVQQLIAQGDALAAAEAEVKRLQEAWEESEAARDARSVAHAALQVKHTELKAQEHRARVNLAEAQAEASQLQAQLRAAVRRTQIAEQEVESTISASPSAALGEAYAQVSQAEDALLRKQTAIDQLNARIVEMESELSVLHQEAADADMWKARCHAAQAEVAGMEDDIARLRAAAVATSAAQAQADTERADTDARQAEHPQQPSARLADSATMREAVGLEQADVASLQERVTAAEKATADAEAALTAARTDSAQTSAQLSSLVEQLEQCMRNVSEHQASDSAATALAHAAVSETQAARADADAVAAALASCQADLAAGQTDLAACRADLAARMTELHEVSESLDFSEERRAEACDAADAAAAELQAVRASLQAAQESLADTQERAESAHAESAADCARADVVGAQAATLREALESALADAAAERDRADAALAEMAAQSDASEAALAAAVSECAAAVSRDAAVKHARAEAELADALDQVQQSQDDISLAATECAALGSALVEAVAARERAEAAQTEAEGARDSLEAALAQAAAERKQLDAVSAEAAGNREIAAHADAAAVREALDAALAEAATQRERADAAHAEAGLALVACEAAVADAATEREQASTAHAEAADARDALEAARADATSERERADSNQAAADALQAALDSQQAAAQAAHQGADASRAELSALVDTLQGAFQEAADALTAERLCTRLTEQQHEGVVLSLRQELGLLSIDAAARRSEASTAPGAASPVALKTALAEATAKLADVQAELAGALAAQDALQQQLADTQTGAEAANAQQAGRLAEAQALVRQLQAADTERAAAAAREAALTAECAQAAHEAMQTDLCSQIAALNARLEAAHQHEQGAGSDLQAAAAVVAPAACAELHQRAAELEAASEAATQAGTQTEAALHAECARLAAAADAAAAEQSAAAAVAAAELEAQRARVAGLVDTETHLRAQLATLEEALTAASSTAEASASQAAATADLEAELAAGKQRESALREQLDIAAAQHAAQAADARSEVHALETALGALEGKQQDRADARVSALATALQEARKDTSAVHAAARQVAVQLADQAVAAASNKAAVHAAKAECDALHTDITAAMMLLAQSQVSAAAATDGQGGEASGVDKSEDASQSLEAQVGGLVQRWEGAVAQAAEASESTASTRRKLVNAIKKGKALEKERDGLATDVAALQAELDGARELAQALGAERDRLQTGAQVRHSSAADAGTASAASAVEGGGHDGLDTASEGPAGASAAQVDPTRELEWLRAEHAGVLDELEALRGVGRGEDGQVDIDTLQAQVQALQEHVLSKDQDLANLRTELAAAERHALELTATNQQLQSTMLTLECPPPSPTSAFPTAAHTPLPAGTHLGDADASSDGKQRRALLATDTPCTEHGPHELDGWGGDEALDLPVDTPQLPPLPDRSDAAGGQRGAAGLEGSLADAEELRRQLEVAVSECTRLQVALAAGEAERASLRVELDAAGEAAAAAQLRSSSMPADSALPVSLVLAIAPPADSAAGADGLQAELTALRGKLRNAVRKGKAVEADRDALRQRLGGTTGAEGDGGAGLGPQHRHEEALTRVAALEAELSVTRAQLRELSDERDEVASRVGRLSDRSHAQVAALETDLGEAQAQLQELRSRTSEAPPVGGALASGSTAQVAALEAELTDTQTKLQEMSDQRRQVAQERNMVSAQRNELAKQLSEAQEENRSFAASLAALSQQHEALAQEQTSLAAPAAPHSPSADTAALGAPGAALEAAHTDRPGSDEARSRGNDSAQEPAGTSMPSASGEAHSSPDAAARTESEAALEAAAQSLAEASARASALEGELQTRSARVDELELELEAAREHTSGLTQDLAAASTNAEAAERALNSHREDSDGVITRLRDAMTDAEDRARALAAELETLNVAHDETQAALQLEAAKGLESQAAAGTAALQVAELQRELDRRVAAAQALEQANAAAGQELVGLQEAAAQLQASLDARDAEIRDLKLEVQRQAEACEAAVMQAQQSQQAADTAQGVVLGLELSAELTAQQLSEARRTVTELTAEQGGLTRMHSELKAHADGLAAELAAAKAAHAAAEERSAGGSVVPGTTAQAHSDAATSGAAAEGAAQEAQEDLRAASEYISRLKAQLAAVAGGRDAADSSSRPEAINGAEVPDLRAEQGERSGPPVSGSEAEHRASCLIQLTEVLGEASSAVRVLAGLMSGSEEADDAGDGADPLLGEAPRLDDILGRAAQLRDSILAVCAVASKHLSSSRGHAATATQVPALLEQVQALQLEKESLQSYIASKERPSPLPMSHSAAFATPDSPLHEVIIDMPSHHPTPDRTRPNSQASGAVVRRDAFAERFGSAVHLPDSSRLTLSDDRLVFRSLTTVPAVRQLPHWAQTALSTVDQSTMLLGRGLLELPGARFSVVTWLVLVHVWLVI